MKFEPPIAEIERFPLRDIISASGEGPTPSEPETSTDDTSQIDASWWGFGQCIHVDRDDDNWENCL